MEHLQGMGESNAVLTRRPYVSRETFLAAAAIYQGEATSDGDPGRRARLTCLTGLTELYGEPDGSVPATFQVRDTGSSRLETSGLMT
jgi:NADH dehydrogenase [ubiquinone] 1 alpha subcomplex assembly factor 5